MIDSEPERLGVKTMHPPPGKGILTVRLISVAYDSWTASRLGIIVLDYDPMFVGVQGFGRFLGRDKGEGKVLVTPFARTGRRRHRKESSCVVDPRRHRTNENLKVIEPWSTRS